MRVYGNGIGFLANVNFYFVLALFLGCYIITEGGCTLISVVLYNLTP